MRVILDTNVIVISLSSYSDYHFIFESLIDKKYDLLLSNDILLEYTEVIQGKYSKRTLDFLISYLQNANNVHKIDPDYKWNLISTDPDDNKFVDCAISGGTDFIVTNDKHFDILKTYDFPKVNVISSDEFIALLKET